MKLAGKTAIVTGGASGIGAGIARRFVAEGARVAIADRDFDAALALARELGPNAIAVATDVADRDSVTALATTVAASFGALDVLVNNAGIGHPPQPLEDLADEDFDRILAVNVR